MMVEIQLRTALASIQIFLKDHLSHQLIRESTGS